MSMLTWSELLGWAFVWTCVLAFVVLAMLG